MIHLHCTQKLYAKLPVNAVDRLPNTRARPKVGANQAQLDAAANALTPLHCDTQCDRSVQGTLNHMKQDLDHLLWYDQLQITDLAPYSAGGWLAQRPCMAKGVKDCIWPQRAMFALLDSANQPHQLPASEV